MKKKIAILGSTGSIGKSLINIIKKDKKNFEIVLLTAEKNEQEYLKKLFMENFHKIDMVDILYVLEENGIEFNKSKL